MKSTITKINGLTAQGTMEVELLAHDGRYDVWVFADGEILAKRFSDGMHMALTRDEDKLVRRTYRKELKASGRVAA